jgi:mono/diheme cytochrome c family protein
MLRIMLVSFALLALGTVLVLGWRGMSSESPPLQLFDDMTDQGKYKPQAPSPYFADGRAMRNPPAGTVAWGRSAAASNPELLVQDEEFFNADRLPVKLDRALLNRGREQFTIHCAVCHGGSGEGKGIMPQYGMINPPSYHVQRLREMPVGEMFRTITLGKGQMNAYGEKVKREERWAIIAYIHALQRALGATLQDVPPELRGELER